MNTIDLRNGNCLDLLKTIPSGSIDLILTDPPYGTVKGMLYHEMIASNSTHEWDVALPTERMLAECLRVLRQNGTLILFSQDPYTSELITQANAGLPFSYRYTWKKDNYGHALLAKKAPLNYTEDVCVFFKTPHDHSGEHPLREYFYSKHLIAKEMGIKWRDVLGNGMASHYFTLGAQFTLPTESNYEKLKTTGLFDRKHEELKAIDAEYRARFPKVFNLPDGKKHKSNVLEYKKDYTGHHPTQKPVALLEDLIKTYTHAGHTVLDFTMGSGSTGVACVNTDRNFIGFELDQSYFEIAQNRVFEAKNLQEPA